MLIQHPPPKKLGIWGIETGRSFQQGYEITTQMLELDDKDNMRVDMLAEFIMQLGYGLPWMLFWGAEGMERLKKEKDSLLIRKAPPLKRASILKLWEEADIVVKLA